MARPTAARRFFRALAGLLILFYAILEYAVNHNYPHWWTRVPGCVGLRDLPDRGWVDQTERGDYHDLGVMPDTAIAS